MYRDWTDRKGSFARRGHSVYRDRTDRKGSFARRGHSVYRDWTDRKGAGLHSAVWYERNLAAENMKSGAKSTEGCVKLKSHTAMRSRAEITGRCVKLKSHKAMKSRAESTGVKLQALVYDILPSTTAVFSYAIGSRKLSANEQFFVGAQTVVSLLQTTLIKQSVSFVAANKVCTSANKTTDGTLFSFSFLFYPGWMRLMFTCVLWR